MNFNGKITHLVSSIEGLLSKDPKDLEMLFDMPSDEIIKELRARLAKGEKLIGSEG